MAQLSQQSSILSCIMMREFKIEHKEDVNLNS